MAHPDPAPQDDLNDDQVHASVAQLFVYPVKSCAGVALQEAELTETGLDLDRAWMVVDATGRFVTQRGSCRKFAATKWCCARRACWRCTWA